MADATSGTGRRVLLATLPLLAAALGGSVDRPGQGGLLLALGLVLLWRPPTAMGPLGRALAAIAGALVVWTALPLLLPAAWFPGATWRTALTEDLAIPLPGMLSPQPWLTADALVLFLAGLAWLWWAAEATGEMSSGRERAAVARTFVLGAAALAVTALVCQRLGTQPPGWRQERGFGPFPNRNQFGSFLATSALLALGVAHADVRRQRWKWAVATALAGVALAVGVFVNYSRAGVVMLFGGAAVYVVASATQDRAKGVGRGGRPAGGLTGRTAQLAVAASVLALLLAGFLLVGGETLGRFTGSEGGARGAAGVVAGDFRWRVQGDALGMMRAMPWCGPGLGNFGALFPFYRDRTTTTSARAIHPESDWLWLGTEAGWPALFLAAQGAALLVWRLRSRRPGESAAGGGGASSVRRAALVGLGAFAAHSFMEVSTHRLGTLFPAALLYALALPASAPSRFGADGGWTRGLFRLLGAGLATVGALWVHATWTGAGWPPGKLAAENLRRAGNAALRARDPGGAVSLLSRAAAIVPLEWGTRFDLGVAFLNVSRAGEARTEFRRARELEPLNPRVPANEATVWLAEGRHPEAVLVAIEETFRRDPATGERSFNDALVNHGQDPALRSGLTDLASREPRLELTYLEPASPGEIWPRLDDVIAADPELTRYAADPPQLRRFLRLWARYGDPTEMAADMARHPAWQPVGWREWGEALVNGGDALAGCQVAERFAVPPELPALLTNGSAGSTAGDPDTLATDFARAPGDFALGLRLFRAQSTASPVRRDAAVETLAALAKLPRAPSYLPYLEAHLRMAGNDGPGAWEAWVRYLQASGQN